MCSIATTKATANAAYRNTTGRNDLVICKTTYDRTNLYFFAQTRHPITPRTDPNWMLLLLDTDQSSATGWLGYDYVVNLEVPTDTATNIKMWKDGAWQSAGKGSFRVNGNGLEIAVLRSSVRQDQERPAFDFHWADNLQSFSGVSELGLNGDSAPNRRWNYRFEVKD